MDSSGSAIQSQQCTTLNVKRFMENFLDEQKGQGPYVDALGHNKPYEPMFPSKLDFVVLSSNPKSPSDPDFDPLDTIEERLYVYVDPSVPNNEGVVSFTWKSNGQSDLVSSLEKAKLQDTKHKEKRDQVLSKLLSLMSPESKTLLNNMHGFHDAKNQNDLWAIFREFLPKSHNQVSTSAVQKRTREFLSSIQDTEFTKFLENFFRNAETFTSDWSSTEHPGYIRIEALYATHLSRLCDRERTHHFSNLPWRVYPALVRHTLMRLCRQPVMCCLVITSATKQLIMLRRLPVLKPPLICQGSVKCVIAANKDAVSPLLPSVQCLLHRRI